MGFGKYAAYQMHRDELARKRQDKIEKAKELLSKGYTSKEIAKELGVTSGSVNSYRREIREKSKSNGIFPFNIFGWFFGFFIFLIFWPFFLAYYGLKLFLWGAKK